MSTLAKQIEEVREEYDMYGKAYAPSVETLLHWMIEAQHLEKRVANIPNLAAQFHQSSSDACQMECSEAEDYENRFREWVNSVHP